MGTRNAVLDPMLAACLTAIVLGGSSFGASSRSGRPAAKGNDRAPLGSPDFYPSPERPVGWRGDGSGSYVVSDPPVTWSRRAMTPIREFRCSADKPTHDRKEGVALVEHSGKFQIAEWLVLGPRDPPDASKPLDGDPVDGEAALSPEEGQRSAQLVWKRVEQVGGVNFESVFGKPQRAIAYAAAYFWSDGEFRCAMGWGGRDLKMWLNGEVASGWDRARHQSPTLARAGNW
jgi:hypothetical protein